MLNWRHPIDVIKFSAQSWPTRSILHVHESYQLSDNESWLCNLELLPHWHKWSMREQLLRMCDISIFNHQEVNSLLTPYHYNLISSCLKEYYGYTGQLKPAFVVIVRLLLVPSKGFICKWCSHFYFSGYRGNRKSDLYMKENEHLRKWVMVFSCLGC